MTGSGRGVPVTRLVAAVFIIMTLLVGRLALLSLATMPAARGPSALRHRHSPELSTAADERDLDRDSLLHEALQAGEAAKVGGPEHSQRGDSEQRGWLARLHAMMKAEETPHNRLLKHVSVGHSGAYDVACNDIRCDDDACKNLCNDENCQEAPDDNTVWNHCNYYRVCRESGPHAHLSSK